MFFLIYVSILNILLILEATDSVLIRTYTYLCNTANLELGVIKGFINLERPTQTNLRNL
jgi:hypothetical protein